MAVTPPELIWTGTSSSDRGVSNHDSPIRAAMQKIASAPSFQ